MASLLLRSAGRVLRRSLSNEPPAQAQPFLDNMRLFSSGGIYKQSCMLEKGLPQRIANSLGSIEANIAANLRIQRATAEQLEVILQKKIENELADKKRERVLLGAFAVLGLTVYLVESRRNGSSQKEKEGANAGAVKALI